MKTEDNIRKHLSEKFNDFEAIPKDQTWEQIRIALDLKDKFKTYEAEPQADSWNNILLATQLGEKFKDYEAEPKAELGRNILLATQLSEKFKTYEVEPKAETTSNILLKTQLSEKFKHYEAEPQAQSWETIKANIQQKDDEKPLVFFPFFTRIGIAASIALVLGIGWLFFRNRTNDVELASVSIENTKPKATKDNGSIDPNSAKEQINIIAKNNTKEIYSNKKSDKIRNKHKSNLVKDGYNAEIQNNHIATELTKPDQIQTDIEKYKVEENTINATDIAINEKNVFDETQQKSLALLSKKDINLAIVNKPFGIIHFNTEIPFEEKTEKIKRNWVFTASLMPLQSYQALTILPQTSTYIQQVGSLNAIDAQRLGVQARFGVMKPLSNRFTAGASLAYAGIQQALSYEINTGQYELQTTDNQNYTLVGVGETVSQNKFLHTAGLKLDNTYLLIPKKNRLFVTGGAEVIKVFGQNQSAYYLNASVAFSTPIKNRKSIWIEPTYRYSLSQSLDANSYVQIRPSTLGLNIRFNFM